MIGKILYQFVAVLLLAVSPAFSQDMIQICADDVVQTDCVKSCASACGDRQFLLANVGYCVDNDFVNTDLAAMNLTDAASCDALFKPPPVPADCLGLTKLSERLRCEQAQSAPSCAESPRALGDDARLLVNEIGAELGKFGDLLETDLTTVNNREKLCAFSLDDLDNKYALASENPALLNVLQKRANGVQTCQNDWEGYVKGDTSKSGGTPAGLPNDLIQATRDQLEVVKVEIAKLDTSIDTLEQAATTIESLARFHILYCDPNGLPEP